MKKCPYCAEEIQDDAIKCRYCHEWLGELEEINNIEEKNIEKEKKDNLEQNDNSNYIDSELESASSKLCIDKNCPGIYDENGVCRSCQRTKAETLQGIKRKSEKTLDQLTENIDIEIDNKLIKKFRISGAVYFILIALFILTPYYVPQNHIEPVLIVVPVILLLSFLFFLSYMWKLTKLLNRSPIVWVGLSFIIPLFMLIAYFILPGMSKKDKNV